MTDLDSCLIHDTSLSLFCGFWHIIPRVRHPNILQLVDVYETKKEYFLFLELWVYGCLVTQGRFSVCLYFGFSLNHFCWSYARGEQSAVAQSPLDMRTALSHKSFGIQIWSLSSCSILISMRSLGIGCISVEILNAEITFFSPLMRTQFVGSRNLVRLQFSSKKHLFHYHFHHLFLERHKNKIYRCC